MRTMVLPIVLALCASTPQARAQSGAAPSTGSDTRDSRIEHSAKRAAEEAQLEAQRAQRFGLKPEEWTRFRELMRGPLGVYSPNLDPLTALGIEARSSAERHHYAELQVRAEARRVEKTLAYQRAYDAAWKRVYPTLQPIRAAATGTNLPDSRIDGVRAGVSEPTRAAANEGVPSRTAVFVKENCPPCEARVKQLQAAGRAFDLYLVGSRHDDARIRHWAAQVGVDPAKVRARTITLNHDAGRWLSIGGRGELPAVVRAVNGHWERE